MAAGRRSGGAREAGQVETIGRKPALGFTAGALRPARGGARRRPRASSLVPSHGDRLLCAP